MHFPAGAVPEDGPSAGTDLDDVPDDVWTRLDIRLLRSIDELLEAALEATVS